MEKIKVLKSAKPSAPNVHAAIIVQEPYRIRIVLCAEADLCFVVFLSCKNCHT